MTTPAKLFGKNLGEYDEVDVDELLAQLSAEEIKILAKEVDPDVSSDHWCTFHSFHFGKNQFSINSNEIQLFCFHESVCGRDSQNQDNFLPPDQRNNYDCEKSSTGPLNRKKLIEHINKEALETPDRPEFEPFVKGKVRGKKWLPPPPDAKQLEVDEKIAIDLGDEYEQALTDASQEEIIDLAGECY